MDPKSFTRFGGMLGNRRRAEEKQTIGWPSSFTPADAHDVHTSVNRMPSKMPKPVVRLQEAQEAMVVMVN